MTFLSFDDCHNPIVRGAVFRTFCAYLKGRRRRSDEEGTTSMVWIRRRRERRAARRAARLLLVLDDLAATQKLPARRIARASLGASR
jgi:hypothetical protein